MYKFRWPSAVSHQRNGSNRTYYLSNLWNYRYWGLENATASQTVVRDLVVVTCSTGCRVLKNYSERRCIHAEYGKSLRLKINAYGKCKCSRRNNSSILYDCTETFYSWLQLQRGRNIGNFEPTDTTDGPGWHYDAKKLLRFLPHSLTQTCNSVQNCTLRGPAKWVGLH
jgi:hypothetical protein